MRCSKWNAQNPAGKKFCGDCGAALANPCSRCSADNPAGKRFCGECCAALGTSAPASAGSSNKTNDAPVRELGA
jgi:hypothetical protein